MTEHIPDEPAAGTISADVPAPSLFGRLNAWWESLFEAAPAQPHHNLMHTADLLVNAEAIIEPAFDFDWEFWS